MFAAIFFLILFVILRLLVKKFRKELARPQQMGVGWSRADRESAENAVGPLAIVSWVALGLVFVFLFFAVFYIGQPGVVGVQKVFGKIQPRVLSEGINVKNPLASVTRLSIKTKMFHMTPGDKAADRSVDVLSSDNMSMSMDLTALLRLDPLGAPFILRFIGDEDIYTEGLILPTLRAALRNVASRYPAQDLMSGLREKVGIEIKNETNKLFTEYFADRKIPVALVCEQALLRDVVPPLAIKKAIEDKLTSEQERDQMTFKIETAKKEAERKVAEARGLADAQAIIDKTLTPEYLQWKYIEILGKMIESPNHSTIILPFDQKLTPMLNIGGTPALKK